MVDIGWDDALSIPTFGLYTAQKQAGGLDVGELAQDFTNVGKNRFETSPYSGQAAQWGGEGGADWYAGIGAQGLGQSNAQADWARQMAQEQGPQAYENQRLSNLEATSRGYHQEGALNLALQGALGNQPSAAAYQMQAGLDQALANQQAMAGGARGAAGLAVAQSNAGANMANLQQNAFNQAGQLRANEIAQYANMYGGLAGQQREQDLQRLGLGNSMSQFNAGNTTQRQLGFGQLANQANQNSQGWYAGMAHGYDANQQGQMEQNRLNYQGWESGQDRGASMAQAEADRQRAERDRWFNMGNQMVNTTVQAGAGGGGGGK